MTWCRNGEPPLWALEEDRSVLPAQLLHRAGPEHRQSEGQANRQDHRMAAGGSGRVPVDAVRFLSDQPSLPQQWSKTLYGDPMNT